MSGPAVPGGLRMLNRCRAHLSGLMSNRMMSHVMMTGGEQPAPFEVFEPRLKFDAAKVVFTTDSTDQIRGQHWPLLG